MGNYSNLKFLFLYSLAAAATAGIGASSSFATLPSNYLSMDSYSKQNILFENMSANPYSSLPTSKPWWWPLSMLKNLVSPSYLITTFTNTSDEMPESRSRLIHTFGVGGKVEFESISKEYSGLFESGAPGIVRLSLAKLRPNVEKDDFVPGLALKLLVNQKPSENIVAIYSLDGQGNNVNFFQNSFSNVLNEPQAPEAKKWPLNKISEAFHDTLEKIPESLRPLNERTLPLTRLARIQLNGSSVTASQIKAPFQLVFLPGQKVQNRIRSNDFQTDFREHLMAIEPGTILYQVFARKNAGDPSLIQIGNLRLTSRLVASSYVDETLFFQHLSR